MKAFEYLKDLPSNWCLIPLGDVVRTQSCDSKLIKGKLPKSPGAGLFPAFSASGQDVWAPKANHKGDAVIVSAVGARCGKCFRATGKWSAIANTHIVWPDANVLDADFLWRAINNENFWIRGQSAQPYVQVSASKRKLIPLPPLPEQKKIAHILSTVQRAIEAQERIIQTTTELFKVMLHKLMSAQIRVSDRRNVEDDSGEDWGMGWEETTISVENPHYFETLNGLWKGKKGPFVEAGVIRNTNFTPSSVIDYTKVAYLNVEEKQLSKRQLKSGDIIIERSGGGPKQPVGRVVFFDRKDGVFSFSNFTSVIRVKDKSTFDPRFVLYRLMEIYQNGQTEDIQRRTTGIRNLDFKAYKERARLPKIPLPEQKKIAHTLLVVQKKIDMAQTKKIKLEDLFRTLLHELMTAKIFVQHLILSNDNHE